MFLYATGEDPDAEVFDRNRELFFAAYGEMSANFRKDRLNQIKISGMGLPELVVYKITEGSLEHISSKLLFELPKLITGSVDEWEILDNHNEFEACFFHERFQQRMPCRQFVSDLVLNWSKDLRAEGTTILARTASASLSSRATAAASSKQREEIA